MSSKLVFCADTVPLEVLESMGFGSDTIRIGDRITFPDSPETAVLSQIEYDKQMYHPGHVSLKFISVLSHVSPASMIRREYLDNLRFIDLIAVGEGDDSFEKLSSDEIVYIAQNYYIQGFSIKNEKADTYSFILECYSFDRKLTLSKYCKAYSDASLATGICNEIIKEQLGELYTKLADVNGFTPDELTASNLFLLGYYLLNDDEKQKAKKVIALQNKSHRSAQEEKELADTLAKYKSMGLLSYDGKLRVSAEDDYGYRTLTGNNKEVTHPYLVQYNESAYDFIARTAHMCGEFFYFEHGQICMGLPKSSRELAFDPAAFSQKEYAGFFSYSAVADDEEARAVASSVEYYHGDYLMGDTVSSGKNRLNSTNVSDESFYPDKKQMKDRIDFGMATAAINTIGTLFTIPGDRITASMESISTFILEIIDRAVLFPNDSGKWLEKHHPDITSRKYTPPGNECTVSDEYVFNMSNEALSIISIMEEAAEQGKVELSFESMLPNLYLGDSIRLSNVEGTPSAVVVRMHGKFHAEYKNGVLSQTKSHFVEVLKYLEYNSQSIGTCLLPFPARSSVPNSLQAVPMTGEVVANNDPCFLGRVKVKFDWEKTAAPSSLPWIRVMVPFAGGGDENGGFCMVPSVGEKVMVDFVDGNINRPFVMGSLYYRNKNAGKDHAPSIGEHPDDKRFYRDDYKTRSIVSGNGHAIIFKDLEDTSLLKMIAPPINAFLPALKKDEFKKTGKRQNPPFGVIKGGGITIKDGTGMCRVDIDPDHRTLKLDSRFGNVEMNAFTGITINAPNGDVTIRGKNIVMEAGNNITLQAGSNIDNTLHPAGEKTEMFGSILGKIAGKVVTSIIKSQTGVDIEGAFDLSYLRSILEIFIRPVEGSLQLKSNRNTIITSGTGKVTLDSSLRSSVNTFTLGRATGNFTAFNALSQGRGNSFLNDHFETQDSYIILKDVISVLLNDVDSYYSTVLNLWKIISRKASNISSMLTLENNLQTNFRNLFVSEGNKIDRISVLKSVVEGKSGFTYNPDTKSIEDFPKIGDVLMPIKVDNDDKALQNKEPLLSGQINQIEEFDESIYKALNVLFTDLCKNIYIIKKSYLDISHLDKHVRRKTDQSRFSNIIPANRISVKDTDDCTIGTLTIKKKDLQSVLLTISLPQIDVLSFEGDWNDTFIPSFSNSISWLYNNLHLIDDSMDKMIEIRKDCVKKAVILKCLLDAKIEGKNLIKFSQSTTVHKDALDYTSLKKKYVQPDKSHWSDLVLRIQDVNSENYRGAIRSVFAFCSSFMDNSVKGVYSYANGKHTALPSLRKLTGYEGEAGPREFEQEVSQAGAIMLSTNAGQYIQFDENNPHGDVRYNPDVDALKRYLLKLF